MSHNYYLFTAKYILALMQHKRGQLYDAIITEIVRGPDGNYKYKVHYKRWNKRLDEFLPLEKITKIDSECISKPAEQVSSSCHKSLNMFRVGNTSFRY